MITFDQFSGYVPGCVMSNMTGLEQCGVLAEQAVGQARLLDRAGLYKD